VAQSFGSQLGEQTVDGAAGHLRNHLLQFRESAPVAEILLMAPQQQLLVGLSVKPALVRA